MIGFWHGELGRIVDARSGEPVPFGRISSDAARLAAIERERHLAARRARREHRREGGRLIAACAAWSTRTSRGVGLHPRLGEVTVEFGLGRFVYDHLEDHADQLEQALGISQPPA